MSDVQYFDFYLRSKINNNKVIESETELMIYEQS